MRIAALMVLGLALVAAPAAFADGGQILLQQTAGAFTVTVFATPEPVSTGDADLTALVQDSASQQPVLDAAVTLTLQPERGLPVRLVLRRTGSRLMYAGSYHFQQSGSWNLTATVTRGTEQVEVRSVFVVALSQSRRVVVWICLLIPALLIGLFVIHQNLKARQWKSGPKRTLA